ncbi:MULTISPECIES: DJ-1/PfpI family protein [Thalassobaculum]|uniref:Transcriptional regulator, AraC family n=1 Tax=Thalassobaculum litoreum DSM 18839 TaxID=1123362 RepID=A0A8G2BHU9_9PROT|nr:MULTISPECIES: DJ-1/PfpI family protein [Thalassobaculum]SDF41078.1 transcriptional regulator, AraC family [Thalassobaculum litoreum DSM 18839]
MRVGFLMFDDLEELDMVGPWEVWTMAGHLKPEIECVTIGPTDAPVRCAKGMRVCPDHTMEACPPLDVLVVPGGQGTRREVNNAELLAWIAKAAQGCTWVTSVCTGSMLLAAAGPARGKRITTHWRAVDLVRGRGEAAEVLDDVRYVRDGNVVSSAGVSAGIDMALWLIGEIWEPAFARQVQRNMEYDPAPPHQGAV